MTALIISVKNINEARYGQLEATASVCLHACCVRAWLRQLSMNV